MQNHRKEILLDLKKVIKILEGSEKFNLILFPNKTWEVNIENDHNFCSRFLKTKEGEIMYNLEGKINDFKNFFVSDRYLKGMINYIEFYVFREKISKFGR